MAQANMRAEWAGILAQLLAASLMLACATTERTFREQTNPGVGGATMGGAQSSVGTVVGGANANGGSSATDGSIAGAQTTATAALGGQSSSSGVGGTLGTGVGLATGGESASPSSTGGASATGGALATGGAPITTGGAPVTGGAATQGGSNVGAGGDSLLTGGAVATGGLVGTGGNTSNCTPTPEVCTDGIDNDCDGNIDCPVISGRFPEPGRAAAGDDAWVQLNAPALAIQAVQCRTGKPGQIGAKLWSPCTSSSPTALTVYSMSGAEAQVPENNGVTRFEFRFLYTNGLVSNPTSIVYYAHNSLWDNVAGTPALACEPQVLDATYFSAASETLTGVTSQPKFAAGEVQLKNPFIALTFVPTHVSSGQNNAFAANSTPQLVSVLSLRHRFVLDPTREMLLVTRSYKARRETSQTCRAAIIDVRDNHTGGVHNVKEFKSNRCDAIVLNKAGSGVCLELVAGVPTIRGIHSSVIFAFLQNLGIPWPKSDMTMWQKLFDDRPPRKTLLNFSDKCRTEDAACFATHASVPGRPLPLSLPDSSDPYFANP